MIKTVFSIDRSSPVKTKHLQKPPQVFIRWSFRSHDERGSLCGFCVTNHRAKDGFLILLACVIKSSITSSSTSLLKIEKSQFSRAIFVNRSIAFCLLLDFSFRFLKSDTLWVCEIWCFVDWLTALHKRLRTKKWKILWTCVKIQILDFNYILLICRSVVKEKDNDTKWMHDDL